MNKKELQVLLHRYASEPMPPWEELYLDFHGARYLDTMAVLGPGEGKSLLDVGAFPGHITLLALHLGFKVKGLTGRAESTPSLDQIIERLGRHQIPVAVGDVESEFFPFPDESFDVVLASEIIEHLHFNPFRLLREAFRVLKPGGRIIVSTPNLARLENLIHLLAGRSVHSKITRRFYEAFSSILSARHLREYTASELTYMLEGQNKEIYRFEKTRVFYSACLDPPFRWPVLAGLIGRFWPRFRSTLLVEAVRPKRVTLIHPEEAEPAPGFYPVEEHSADMDGIARMFTTPFRWTRGSAELSLPAGQALYQVFFLHLVYLAPISLHPVILTVGVGEKIIGRVSLSPDREFTPIRIILPVGLACEGRFTLRFHCPTWRPADHPGKDDYEFSLNDSRDLGLVMGWDGFLREDCRDLQALLKLIEGDLLHPGRPQGVAPCWIPPHPIYLLRDKKKTFLRMGSEDWRHLGWGWHQIESWENGLIRWSSGLAEAYLSAGPGAGRLSIRLFTGERALGEEVTGDLELGWVSDRLLEGPSTRTAFNLPAAVWTDLQADLPPPLFSSGGVLRAVLRVDPARVPALIVPDSQDRRELGLAVAGMTLYGS